MENDFPLSMIFVARFCSNFLLHLREIENQLFFKLLLLLLLFFLWCSLWGGCCFSSFNYVIIIKNKREFYFNCLTIFFYIFRHEKSAFGGWFRGNLMAHVILNKLMPVHPLICDCSILVRLFSFIVHCFISLISKKLIAYLFMCTFVKLCNKFEQRWNKTKTQIFSPFWCRISIKIQKKNRGKIPLNTKIHVIVYWSLSLWFAE